MTESCKGKMAEAPATFISVDNARALVTVGELVRYKEVHDIVLPNFYVEFTEVCAIEGEEVLTLRFEERGTQKCFVNTCTIPINGERRMDRNARKAKRRVQEDWSKKKKNRAKDCWLEQGGVAKHGRGTFLFSKEGTGSCFQQKVGTT